MQVPPPKELRKLMRIQSLCCNALCNQSVARLSVTPIHGSCSQAIRCLFIHWGVALVGESGDSDYQELLGGLYRTIILKGKSHPHRTGVRVDASRAGPAKSSPRRRMSSHLTQLKYHRSLPYR